MYLNIYVDHFCNHWKC